MSEYLNYIEELAVGVKQDVFDLGTLSMLEGTRLIDVIGNYAPYIESVREQLNGPTIWGEIDELIKMIKAEKMTTVPSTMVQHESAATAPPRTNLNKLDPAG